MSDDEEVDKIAEDPDEQVEDDEMSPAEAGFVRGEEEAEVSKKKKEEEEDEDDDEVK